MKSVKCIHPIKVNRIIADFLNEAVDLPIVHECFTENYSFDAIVKDITKLPSFEKITAVIEHQTKFIVKGCGDQLTTYAVTPNYDDDYNYVVIVPSFRKTDYSKNFDNDASMFFRKNFERRCPMAKGFADVTISVLHEAGHVMTNYEAEEINENVELVKAIANSNSWEEFHECYFNRQPERLATDWAIEWLQNAENRKLAKAFEKKFWACFE